MISRITQRGLRRFFVKMAHDPKVRTHFQKIIADAKRPHKYGAKATTIDGIRFASKKEGKRYGELKLLAKAGEIRGLELQPEFLIKIRGDNIFTYRADFSYRTKDGHRVVEDVKGVRTPVYKLKKKIVEAIYDLEITEI